MPSKAKKCDMLIIMQFHWKSPRYDAWFLGLILTNSVTTISLLNLSVYWGPHLQNGIIWLLVIKIRWIKYVRWLANWVPRSSLHECRLSPSAPEGTEREPAPYRDCLRVTPPPHPAPSPQGSARCCPRSGWTAGCAWSPLPSARQCPESDSCFRSGGRCTWASCQRRSPSPFPASSSLGCAGLVPRWSEQSLPKSEEQSEKLTGEQSHRSVIRERSDFHGKGPMWPGPVLSSALGGEGPGA